MSELNQGIYARGRGITPAGTYYELAWEAINGEPLTCQSPNAAQFIHNTIRSWANATRKEKFNRGIRSKGRPRKKSESKAAHFASSQVLWLGVDITYACRISHTFRACLILKSQT